MTKPVTIPPDAERVAVDILTAALAARGEDVTVGMNIPQTWTPGTKAHMQVALDGTPGVIYPIMWSATVRVTAWHESTTTAKRLAVLCQALLCSYVGSASVGSVRPLTGVLPALDADTKAQLASTTTRMNLLGIVV